MSRGETGRVRVDDYCKRTKLENWRGASGKDSRTGNFREAPPNKASTYKGGDFETPKQPGRSGAGIPEAGRRRLILHLISDEPRKRRTTQGERKNTGPRDRGASNSREKARPGLLETRDKDKRSDHLGNTKGR